MTVVIFHHARVHSDAGPGVRADALATAGGRLLAVGRADEVEAAFPRARRVDLRGLDVFPGLIDAHLHFVSYGMSLLQVELRETRSIVEAVRLLGQRAEDLPTGELVDAAAAVGMVTRVGDPMLRVGPLKIFADGALGSQTGSMLEPYAGQPGNVGIRVRTRDEIDQLVRKALRGGLWTAIHAIGDRANRDVLAVLEQYAGESRRLGARHRIEHVQVTDPDDLPRLARLGVVASMQPIHATTDRDIADRYWGVRARWSYAWHSLAATGAVLAFGSDAPVETPDPWRGLYAAVTRKREGEPDGRPWYPQECVSLEQAMRAYTVGPAYAAGAEIA